MSWKDNAYTKDEVQAMLDNVKPVIVRPRIVWEEVPSDEIEPKPLDDSDPRNKSRTLPTG